MVMQCMVSFLLCYGCEHTAEKLGFFFLLSHVYRSFGEIEKID